MTKPMSETDLNYEETWFHGPPPSITCPEFPQLKNLENISLRELLIDYGGWGEGLESGREGRPFYLRT